MSTKKNNIFDGMELSSEKSSEQRVNSADRDALRDFFAGQVIQGLYATNDQFVRSSTYDSLAGIAYKQADALIAHRSEPTYGVWTETAEMLPPEETPVLIMHNDEIKVGEIRWDFPTFEETWSAYRYWDNPYDDGQDWEWGDVTHWMPLPPPINVRNI